MLTNGFEEIRIKDDESFDDFYTKKNDIVNYSFSIDEKTFETKIGQKVL